MPSAYGRVRSAALQRMLLLLYIIIMPLLLHHHHHHHQRQQHHLYHHFSLYLRLLLLLHTLGPKAFLEMCGKTNLMTMQPSVMKGETIRLRTGDTPDSHSALFRRGQRQRQLPHRVLSANAIIFPSLTSMGMNFVMSALAIACTTRKAQSTLIGLLDLRVP